MKDQTKISRRNFLGRLGKVFLGVSLVGKLAEKTNAAEIQIASSTTQPTSPKVDNMSAYFRTFNDANEVGDYHDGHFLESPDDYALEVSSNEPSFKASINAKPFNTPQGEFDLSFYSRSGGNYPGTLDHKVRIRVKDAQGLEHRNVVAYDITNPDTLHYVPINGDIIEIQLPDLVNSSPGKIATWHIATPAKVKGDIASAQGVGKLDGKRDFHDLKALGERWLTQTFEGENFSWADLNYDGIDNFADFAIMVNGD